MAAIYFETTTSFICAGQFACIVNHWVGDDAAFNGTMFDNAEAAITSLVDNGDNTGLGWPTYLADMLSNDSFVSAIRCRVIRPTSGPTAVRLFTTSDYVGQYGGTLDAFQTAGVIIWATASSGPRFGRSFLPGVSSSALVNNRFDDGYTSLLPPLVAECVAGFSENLKPLSLVIKHGPSTTPSFDPVVGGFISPTPGSIKARRIPV